MTIQYKNAGYELDTTNLTTVLTIDASSRAICKGYTIANEHSNNVDMHIYFHDSSETTSYVIYHKAISADTTEYPLNGEPLNLEEGDSLVMQADNAGTIHGVISYALINRSQENG
tara:strand:- start:118 stop:462 length:345 start_codon:yes stop_codon:yes gene_type:complete